MHSNAFGTFFYPFSSFILFCSGIFERFFFFHSFLKKKKKYLQLNTKWERVLCLYVMIAFVWLSSTCSFRFFFFQHFLSLLFFTQFVLFVECIFSCRLQNQCTFCFLRKHIASSHLNISVLYLFHCFLFGRRHSPFFFNDSFCCISFYHELIFSIFLMLRELIILFRTEDTEI